MKNSTSSTPDIKDSYVTRNPGKSNAIMERDSQTLNIQKTCLGQSPRSKPDPCISKNYIIRRSSMVENAPFIILIWFSIQTLHVEGFSSQTHPLKKFLLSHLLRLWNLPQKKSSQLCKIPTQNPMAAVCCHLGLSKDRLPGVP